jgi:hypothetical protein
MKAEVKVIYPDGQSRWCYLTTEHPQCSNSLPVLVDSNNHAYGTADLPPGTVIMSEIKNRLINEGARRAGYQIQED